MLTEEEEVVAEFDKHIKDWLCLNVDCTVEFRELAKTGKRNQEMDLFKVLLQLAL